MTMVSLTTFSSSSMDIKFRWDIFNSFASSSNFVLLIYFLLLQARLQKYSCLFFTTQNIHHHHHSICSIDGFLNQCIYTLQNTPEDDSFYFVCIQRQSLSHGTSWEFVLMHSFHGFSLPCIYLPFTGSLVSFSNSCNSTLFQMFLYKSTHSSASETLNHIA